MVSRNPLGVLSEHGSNDSVRIICDFDRRLFSLPLGNTEKIRSSQYLLREQVKDRLRILSGGEAKAECDLLNLWIEEADDFIDRFLELLLLFGVDLSSSSLDDTRMFWRVLHSAGVLISNLKYSVNVAFCRHFDLEMPEKIEFDFGLDLFPRSFRIALGRLRADSRRFKKTSLYLINSMFQGWKKGLLPLDITGFDRTMNSHRKNLCETEGEVSEEIGDDIYRIGGDLLQSYSAPSRESSNLVTSTSATIEFGKQVGGSLSVCMREYLGNRSHVFLQDEFLLGFITKNGIPSEIRGFGPTCSELKEFEVAGWRDSLFSDLQVLPYGVLEPLKIRTITRPTYTTHWGLRGVQKSLLQYLNRWDSFSITGDSNKEHLSSHCQNLVQNEECDDLGFFDFISGDFSAATDTLKSGVTRIIWDLVGERGLPWWLYVKGKRSLCDTSIIYDERVFPKLDEKDPYRNFVPTSLRPEPIAQRNGQLMGNIISFPVLCIANYIAWHRSMERYYGCQKTVAQLVGLHVKINGDDILFRSNSVHYLMWKHSIADFGFRLSLGKNLCHREIFQINSQLFKVHRDCLMYPCGSSRVSYFNFGQLTGRKKGMDSKGAIIRYDGQFDSCKKIFDHEDRIQELSSVRKNFLDMYQGCPSSLKGCLKSLQRYWFFRRFQDLLTRAQVNCLSLPFEFGGLGFEGVLPSKKFDREDQLMGFFQDLSRMECSSTCYANLVACGRFTPERHYVKKHPKCAVFNLVAPPSLSGKGDRIERSSVSLEI